MQNLPILSAGGSNKVSSYKDSEFERTELDPTYVGKTPKQIGFFDAKNITASDYDFGAVADKTYLPPVEEEKSPPINQNGSPYDSLVSSPSKPKDILDLTIYESTKIEEIDRSQQENDNI